VIKLSSIGFRQKYQLSPQGLLYIAPTGSGKTREAIAVTKDDRTSVVGTASLTKNFEQEELKAFKTKTPRTVETYAGIARTKQLPGGKHLIIDESQYIRNPETKTFRNLARERTKYDKALLLTGTPLVNEPYDIVSQVNLVGQSRVLTPNKKEFYKKYYEGRKTSPGIFASLAGVKPSYSRALRNSKELKSRLDPYVYLEDVESVQKYLPKRNQEIVQVPMGEHQQQVYKYISGKLPYSMRYKIRRGLLPSKQEAGKLNTYLSGLRQVSNTTSPFVAGKSQIENPKIQQMMRDMTNELSNKGKVVIYSNYLGAGVDELKKSLQAKNISYSQVIGSMSKSVRQKQVEAYNKNKNRVMLITGAGSEGINLPKTTLVQLTEPHWNAARLYQASSRAIRRGDDPKRTVNIKLYQSVFPKKENKLLGIKLPAGKPQRSVDQYLYDLSKSKEKEISEFLGALR